MKRPGVPVIIPVKALRHAKQRLAGVLTLENRRRLVLAMLADVLETLRKVERIGDVLVVSPDVDVAARVQARGCIVIAEASDCELNAAIGLGLAHETVRAAGRAIVLPGDVPLARVDEIARVATIATASSGPRVGLVPSHDGAGTNAMALAPPDVLEPAFGPDSFATHLASAVARRIDTEVLQLSGLAADIDLPADLEALRQARLGVRRYAFLTGDMRSPQTIQGDNR